MKLRDGAWGGGNLFGRALAGYLGAHGARVRFDLSAADVDVILLTHPDPTSESSAFGADDVLEYLRRASPEAIVVQRINNSSEARGDAGNFNRTMIRASAIADHTVFVSHWLRERYVASGFRKAEHSVVLNGANPAIFFPKQNPSLLDGGFRLVTHHWSTNPRKGFAIYAELDRMIGRGFLGGRLAFTYVGRLPANLELRHTCHIPPQSPAAVADILRAHDIYVTAAESEGGGMHYIEGAMCGLPVLYPKSGGTPEYCRGYGVEFEPPTFGAKLAQIVEHFDEYRSRMASYPYTSPRMCQHYLDLFGRLLDQRQAIVRARRLPRRL
jgi:glycosyltransferase involved in cell wall biosynthesis